jgi:HlyD family secretion protein
VRRLLGWLAVGLVVAGAAAGVVLYRRYQGEQASAAQQAALRTEVVQRGDIVAAVNATGSVLAERQAQLFFVTPGTVAEVMVADGDRVQAGQVLARLDVTELRLAVQQAEDALAIAQLNRQKLQAGPSEDDIAVARANLRSANARAGDLGSTDEQEVAIAQVRYDNLQADYQKLADQYNYLVQFGLDHPQFAAPADVLEPLKANMEIAYYAAEIGRLQLELARQGAGKGQRSVAYAQIVQAQAALSQTLAAPTALQFDQAGLAVEQAETALARARLRLEHTELVAPYDGVVASVAIKAGEPASLSQPAMTVLDLRRYHLDVSVDEVDVVQLDIGQPLSVTVDALPGVRLAGRVDRIAPAATTAGGLVNYSVRLVLDATGEPLRVGMSATANIVVAEARGVVLVPNWAIRRDRRSGQAYASLKDGDALREVSITTGLRGESYTEVTGGVQAGDVAAISTQREGIDVFGGP